MSYFKPSTNPSPARYDLLARHEETEITEARREITREPYVTNERSATWVGDRIAAVVENPAPLWWYIAVSFFGGLASFAGLGILYLICTGVGVWGENNSANWAWDITNFVFWIGIGHAGTMIAAILYLTRQRWASGINRAAEAMTIFAVMCAGIYPGVHVGRVWMAWYLAPIPNGNAIWPNFRSPLLWDVFAVSTYLSVSIMFWYVGLIPDAATMRDRVKNKILKYFYAVICMGWRGSAKQWTNYEFCYLMLAGIATLLVITTCTVVSSDFSTSVIPGWHGTIFIPYFGVGAIYGGFCMLIILLVPIRQLYHLEDLLTLRHIDMCCRFVLLMALLISYIYGMEFFISYYSGNPNEWYHFYENRMLGPYWHTWQLMMIFNCLVPQLFWSKKIRRSPWLAMFIVIFPSIGMWLERFIIIVCSIHRDFLPSSWGMFYPTWVDILTFAGTFGIFFLMYLLFIRFIPVIAISEVRGVLPEANPHDAPVVEAEKNGAAMSNPLVCPIGSGQMPKKLYAIGAEFDSPKSLYAAAEKIRDRGFKGWDCYTPYYIHGLDKAMGLGKSYVNLFTIAGGLTGLIGGFLLVTITAVYVYPMDTQGKPYFSLPGFVPILDLLMIFLSAAISIVGMTVLSGLPRLHHPLWEWEAFNRATHDKFFIVIEANDPRFNEKTSIDLLTEIGGTNLTYIGDEE